MRSRLIALLVISGVAVSCSLAAQTYTPQQIVFKGAPDLPQAALAKVFGIAPGKPIANAEIRPALQRLADTGLFADMRYFVDNRALTVDLTPQPANDLLPAVFTNFVLFQPGQLTPLVAAKVPLFTGKIPLTGTLQQSVQDALTAILQEKGIAGATVDVVGHSDKPGAVTSIAFSISNPPVQLRTVHVDGVSALAQAKVDAVRQAFAANDYGLDTEDSVRQRLEDAYKDLAFLDIAVDPPTRSAAIVEPTRIAVDLTTSVHEGAQYRVAKLDLPASPIVPADEIAKSAALKPGDLATRIGVLQTAARIDRQFTKRGYMDAKISYTTQKDAATHTVTLALTVAPGEQFRLRTVKALNLNAQQQQDFDANWKLAPGSLYDEEYVQTFLKKNTAIRSLQGFSASYKQIGDTNTHTVDLLITFVKGGVLVTP